jgi:hypothetical protein
MIAVGPNKRGAETSPPEPPSPELLHPLVQGGAGEGVGQKKEVAVKPFGHRDRADLKSP